MSEMLVLNDELNQRFLTLLWLKFFSYRNQSIDLLCKSMDRFLYDRDLRHERVNVFREIKREHREKAS